MSEPDAPQFEVDQVVTFTGYKSELPAGMEPIFTKGQQIKLLAPGDEKGSFKAGIVDNLAVQDTVYPVEIEAIAAKRVRKAPAANTAAKVTATAPAKADKAKAKTKAAAPKAAAPKAEAAPPKAAKGKTKVKAEKPVKQEVVIPDTAAVAKLVNKDALEAASELNDNIERSFFTLGGVLKYIRDHKSYESITNDKNKPAYVGVDGFAAYVEQELGTKYRKAMYLIDIYTHFRAKGLDEANLAKIGWSKAALLARVADDKKFPQLMEYAETHTKDEVENKVKKTIVKAGGTATATKIAFGFRLFEDKAEVFKQACELAGQKIDKEELSDQIDFIVTEWLSIQEGADVPQASAIAAVEARYGIKLTEVENGATAKAKAA